MKTGRIAAPLFVLIAAAIFVVAFYGQTAAQSNPTVITKKSDSTEPAQKAYELYLAKFRQMSAAYPQVLNRAAHAVSITR